jgi:hypothetical protein
MSVRIMEVSADADSEVPYYYSVPGLERLDASSSLIFGRQAAILRQSVSQAFARSDWFATPRERQETPRPGKAVPEIGPRTGRL